MTVTQRKSSTQNHPRKTASAMLWLSAVAVLLLGPLALARAQYDIAQQFGTDKYNPLIDWPMLKEPVLPVVKSHIVFNPELKRVMGAALSRPDVETRRHAVEAIADAYSRGCKEMKSFAPQLLAKLGAKDIHAVERLTIIAGLIKLEYSEAGPEFVRLNLTGEADLILATDRALAQWKTPGMDAAWCERIASEKTTRAIRASAIEAAGVARVSSAVQPLLAVALDRTGDVAFRMVAASSAGAAKNEGLETSALQLLDATAPAPSTLDRVIGCTLLREHKGDAAQGILLRMATDPEPAVITVAAGRLLEVDPLLLTPVAVKLSGNDDPGVRLIAAKSLAAQKTVAAVNALAPLLSDPAPQVRAYARDQMILLDAVEGLSSAVRTGATKVLAKEDWRGLEGASLVLGKLNHKPAIDRLMKIKTNARDEVRLAAVTAIRWLAIPETLPQLLEYVDSLSKDAPEKTKLATGTGPAATAAMEYLRRVSKQDVEISQLMQFFGTAKYKPAEPTMRKFIPKKSMPFNSARAAAIWSLGQLHLDDADGDLGDQFLSRYTDTRDIMNPESGEVRHMALISMGYIKYRKLINPVMTYLKDDNSSSIAAAGRWAIKHVSGREMPEPPDGEDMQSGWFIEPRRPESPPAAPAAK